MIVTIVTILFVFISIVMILTILLQAGKGGGLGTALGGGASQSVFGGSGGADFMARLTQGFAVSFMVAAMYLAYAGAHSGSSRLQALDQDDEPEVAVIEEDGELNINFEQVLGPNPLRLPSADEARKMRGGTAAPPAAPAAPVPEPTDEGSEEAQAGASMQAPEPTEPAEPNP